MIQLSNHFLSLLQQQLESFEADRSVKQLVVYVAKSGEGENPSLEAVGYWPVMNHSLPPVEHDPELLKPSSDRRWYPLQEDQILLGVLRAEVVLSSSGWPEALDQRLQATSGALTHCLSLELEKANLLEQVTQQKEQIGLMVHQLRNPLSALRTYAQLLLRKLGPDSKHRNLVEGLLSEQDQLNTYISALDQIGQSRLVDRNPRQNSPLLLPPVLSKTSELTVKNLLVPLLARASATASLEGRKWEGPDEWPDWTNQPLNHGEGVIAEIIANLLENAFRYSTPLSPIGLCFEGNSICVWDGGTPIPLKIREKIFERGFRGTNSENLPGGGLGLALARQLAEELGGSLELAHLSQHANELILREGNTFILRLPEKTKQE